MLAPPKVPCRLMQDDDPAPLFPCEPVSGNANSLGSRLEESIQRLEKRIDQLVVFLAAAKPIHSAWAEDVRIAAEQDVRRNDLRRDCEDTSHGVQDDNSDTSTHQLRTISEEEEEENISNDAANQKVPGFHSESGSSKPSESDKRNSKRRFSSGNMRSPSGILEFYENNTTLRQHSKRHWIVRAVMSKYFDTAISIVVIVNALMLGWQIDMEVKQQPTYRFFKYFEWVCTIIFTLEIALRLWVVGIRRMCIGTERLMTLMDISLVICSLAEALIDVIVASGSGLGSSSFVVRLLKVLRIGRLLRPLRTVGLLGELRVIAAMIASSFRALFWLACIVAALAYCFSLILTQGVANYLNDASLRGSLPEEYTEVQKEYGSVLHTMYTLFLSMTGGRDWGEIAGLIANAGLVYGAVVVCFVFINLFSVLNIVTGIFVDGAIELARRDRAMMIEKQSVHREANRTHLVELLSHLDTNGDGAISKDEFFSALQAGGVQEFMDALGIDPDNAAEVFLLLDADGDGVVHLMEFIQGMEKIRGEARSVDIQMLLLYNRKIMDFLNGAQGTRSSMLARKPVEHVAKARKPAGRWDEPPPPHLSPAPVHMPGLRF